MRYLGNKERLLPQIAKVLKQHHIHHGTFGDLFSGSGSVSDYFKNNFKIVGNDFMHYATIFTQAKVQNSNIPKFKVFVKHLHQTPFQYLNNYDYQKDGYHSFIYRYYSPAGNRMFFTKLNAIKIDTMRKLMGIFYKQHLINHNEYIFLIASLLESTMRVSNTSGTYEAFFKKWESRAKKKLVLRPLSMKHSHLYSNHDQVYNKDTNELIRQISGDVAYIDTPYNTRQYSSAYGVLETIANNDVPAIHGKTGLRNDNITRKSMYSNRRYALDTFEDLLRQLQFKHVIISYSNQSLIPLPKLITLIKKFAINHQVEVHKINFREYKNINKSSNTHLQEVLIYFNKDLSINKSPLEYSGSKDSEMDKLTKFMPKHISNFVDCCGGAFNVGSNVVTMNKIYYNDNNPFVYQIIRMILNTPKHKLIQQVSNIVKEFNLKRNDKQSYQHLRAVYNQAPINQRSPLLLYVLSLYSFSNMIRFNAHGKFNVPVGKSAFTKQTIQTINHFHTKSPVGKLMCKSFNDININKFDKDTLFYFDPPYIITSASYNDGKRYKAQWTKQNEQELLNKMNVINKHHQKFLLSNVLKHRGKVNYQLIHWIHKYHYDVKRIGKEGKSGKSRRRIEVIVKNY